MAKTTERRKPMFLKIRGSKVFVLATVGVGLFVDMVVYGIVVPIIPFIILSIDNGQSPEDVDPNANPGDNSQVSRETGILLALFAAGLLSDRLQRRQGAMLIGILGLIASTLLFMFSRSYWQLLLARFLQGFSDSCVWILCLCLVADTFPQGEMGLQMGKVMVCYSIGMTSGPPIGALYHQMGFKAPFVFCIIMAAIDFVMRLLIVERRNNPKEWFDDVDKRDPLTKTERSVCDSGSPASTDDATATATPLTANKVSIIKLMSYGRMWGALLITFIMALVIGSIEPTLTLRLAEEWNYNTSQIGLAFLAQVLPGFASGPLAGWLADRYGAKIVILGSTVVSAVMLALLGVPNRSTGIAPLIVLLVLEGFFGSAVLSPVLSEIAAVVEIENTEDGNTDGFAKSYAVFNIAFAGGMLVGPLLGGFVYSAIGFFWLNIILACALVVCIPPIYFLIGVKGRGLIQRPVAKAESIKEEKTTNVLDEGLADNNDRVLEDRQDSLSKVPTVEEVPVSNKE
ncbi:hypothetical protein NQZ79_g7305 [Umbelopsis isabellina]|nr:hypothetical protein NQZ79_g7305 [Umbelopsis isabellina]